MICGCRFVIWVMATGSVVGPIHQTPFWPNSDSGILVMISDASAVTVVVADAGIAASLKAGFTKLLGSQSSKKIPIVFAIAGSTAGVMAGGVTGTTGGVTGGGAGLVFLQEKSTTANPMINDAVYFALKICITINLNGDFSYWVFAFIKACV